ncbi:ABC transporter permease [Longibacter salinarum]|uniref:ABC transporter permease n=1 Tax=Longibacter salinarum TaxID=1850348 RepID=A0A2A8CUV7_9BACT|nr:ABC transporter permease [Longibacter salinarum]PEN12244.1 ABC transporter permease [Longibacter salinarum]
MQKILLILRSEFWRRARSKAFILATLLVPVFIVLASILPSVFIYLGEQQSDDQTIAVVDETGRLLSALQAEAGDGTRYQFTASDAPADSLRDRVLRGDLDAYLVLPATLLDGEGTPAYFSTESGGMTGPMRLENLIERTVRNTRLTDRNVPDEVRQIMNANLNLSAHTITEEGTEQQSALSGLLGLMMALAVYIAVFVYGQYVMQGVIEEKSNRVVEVVVSSVKPFELLMGKVLGIGSLGLMQMVVWLVLAGAGLTFGGTILALFLDPADLGVAPDASSQAMMEAAGVTLPTVPLSLIFWFIMFFLGGYLLYASLFAAVGSAVEQQQDAQNLLYVVVLPLVIPIIAATYVLQLPNSTMSVVLSHIPFFSPVLMPVRMSATTVPTWEVLIAYALLGATFMVMIWLASRIYRVGIFMYGKAASLSEIARWATRQHG